MKYRFQHREQIHEVSIERRDAGYHATVDGQSVPFEPLDSQPGQVSLRLGDQAFTLYVAGEDRDLWVSVGGCAYRLERPASRKARQGSEASGGAMIRAPMPAQVRAVQAQPGDIVTVGQVLLLLEAMKMEIRIKSPAAGVVARVAVKPGQAVEKEQVLVELQAQPER